MANGNTPVNKVISLNATTSGKGSIQLKLLAHGRLFKCLASDHRYSHVLVKAILLESSILYNRYGTCLND